MFSVAAVDGGLIGKDSRGAPRSCLVVQRFASPAARGQVLRRIASKSLESSQASESRIQWIAALTPRSEAKMQQNPL
jgi:Spy/CpxP family protein refolding chaperone